MQTPAVMMPAAMVSAKTVSAAMVSAKTVYYCAFILHKGRQTSQSNSRYIDQTNSRYIDQMNSRSDEQQICSSLHNPVSCYFLTQKIEHGTNYR